MVDAGSRAASVTIHRVTDVEHGLGNVTGEIMLAALLNHWVKYYGKPDIVRTDPEVAFGDQVSYVVWLPKAYVSTSILVKRPGKQEFLGKHVIQSNSQQFVWLEGLLTVSRFKKSLMNALQLTMTNIETVDPLRGSCCWEKQRRTKQLAKILIWLSAVSKWWTKLRNSVSV